MQTNSFLSSETVNWLSRFFEMDGFVVIYIVIVLLIAAEYLTRKKIGVRLEPGTPGRIISFWATCLRLFLLICALPLLVIETAFVMVMGMAALSFDLVLYLPYLKWFCFIVLMLLVLAKAFFEWKFLSSTLYLVTLGFGIPIIGLLYFIYTYWF